MTLTASASVEKFAIWSVRKDLESTLITTANVPPENKSLKKFKFMKPQRKDRMQASPNAR